MKITFDGKPLNVNGTQLQKGEKAPDFNAVTLNLEPWSLSNIQGVKILSSVPSLDTSVCQTQTHKFNKSLATLKGIELITISLDLPFAQQRWCGADGINTTVLSDYQNREFAQKYALLIDELKLLVRAVLVLDSHNIIQYVEYVGEIKNEPNYEKALEVAKSLL
ncbi:MAG: thiol peroxidase [Brevinema sp.]